MAKWTSPPTRTLELNDIVVMTFRGVKHEYKVWRWGHEESFYLSHLGAEADDKVFKLAWGYHHFQTHIMHLLGYDGAVFTRSLEDLTKLTRETYKRLAEVEYPQRTWSVRFREGLRMYWDWVFGGSMLESPAANGFVFRPGEEAMFRTEYGEERVRIVSRKRVQSCWYTYVASDGTIRECRHHNLFALGKTHIRSRKDIEELYSH